MDDKNRSVLKKFLKAQRIRFNNLDLLDLAFSHRSFANERNHSSNENNEKLEFLGDSVLGLIITEYLYKNYEGLTEGDFARIKSYIVSEEMLSTQARKIGLNRYIKVGKGEELTGGREKKAIIADSFEAFLGALYLDSKYSKVEEFVIKLFKDEIELVVSKRHGWDYKTLLQEFVQKKYKDCPRYQLTGEEGPEHNKTFYMEVFVNEKLAARGEGKSKKEAEKTAAKIAYLKLTSQYQSTEAEKNGNKG